MRHRTVVAVILAAIAALTPSSAQPQQVLQLKLGTPTELTAVEFSRVADARELSDGRLLIGDALEKQLFVVDFSRQTATKLGRLGGGPGEYRGVGRLLRAKGDTTLLVDAGGGRWLVMARDSFVSVVSSGPAIEQGRNPIGADALGHLLGTKPSRRVDNAIGGINAGQVNGTVTMTNDSSWLVRVNRTTGHLDTLTKFRIRPGRVAATASGGVTTSVSIVLNPVSTGEQAVMFDDGAIAVARLDPYRVDWFVNGRVATGGPLPFTAVPLSRDEKVAVLARLPRNDGDKARDPEAVNDWPAVVPPFPSNSVVAGSDGNLWIRRTPSLRAPRTDYDVVDRNGRLKGRLHLPENEVIIAFGRSSMYVIATDDDDLQHLKRYPIPR